MFCVNDTVLYGATGICRIADIRREKFGGEEKLYYVLIPADNETSTIYCPVDGSKVKIRRLLSAGEIMELIRYIPEAGTEWIDNDQQRKESFGEILRRGDRRELVGLLKTLYQHREEIIHAGKKFRQSDEKIMREAEKILHGEFAHVLNIAPDEVVPFIMGQLEPKEKRDLLA